MHSGPGNTEMLGDTVPMRLDVESAQVSVVIVCRDYGSYLREAIESVVRQTWPPLEVLVMDGGSTDSTSEVVRAYGHRLRYFRFGPLGAGALRQQALWLVHGDFFLNLDADDVLEPGFIERTVSVFTQWRDMRLAFVYTQEEFFGEARGVSRHAPFDIERLRQGNFIGPSALIRTDVLRKFGFDPQFSRGWSDYDLFLTLAERGYYGALVDSPLLRRRVHAGSQTDRMRRTGVEGGLWRAILRKHGALYPRNERWRRWAESWVREAKGRLRQVAGVGAAFWRQGGVAGSADSKSASSARANSPS